MFIDAWTNAANRSHGKSRLRIATPSSTTANLETHSHTRPTRQPSCQATLCVHAAVRSSGISLGLARHLVRSLQGAIKKQGQ